MTRFPTDKLAQEWPALATGILAVRLRVWAHDAPVLRPFESPQALITFLRSRRADLDRKDAILVFLLERAHDDELAARVLLEAILPGLKRLAGSLFHEVGEEQELSSLLLWCAWEEIHAYPLRRRPTRIAANLLLDTRKRIRAELAEERRQRSVATRLEPSAPSGGNPAEGDIDALLARAVAAGAMSEEEAELIARTRVDGDSVAAVAEEDRLPYITVYMRRHRAERRLLLFLGLRPVKNQARNRRLLGARVVGAGLTGSAGGGAVTHPKQRR
jgi:DNA-directed RNA polymerase specialized sigma24 family protein